MKNNKKSKTTINFLQEREKELNCLYKVEEILRHHDITNKEIFLQIIKVLPYGFCYPENCQVKIEYYDSAYHDKSYKETLWKLEAPICLSKNIVGKIIVTSNTSEPELDNGPFLKEEEKLISTVAERIGQTLLYKKLDKLISHDKPTKHFNDWRSVLELLSLSDQELYLKIARKMFNYLYSNGVDEIKSFAEHPDVTLFATEISDDEFDNNENKPLKKRSIVINLETAVKIFEMAAQHLDDDQVFIAIEKWIKENQACFLVKLLDDNRSSLSDIILAIKKYKEDRIKQEDLPQSTLKAINTSLIRRFFNRRLDFIEIAKKALTIEDYDSFTKRLIYPSTSDGRVGGKGSGLFVAKKILEKETKNFPELSDIKKPKTWYIASDGIIDFINYNHLQELREYKYKKLSEIKMDYQNIVELFKNSPFSPEMERGLSVALDDFDNKPLVIRSSSLLEDSMDAAFSGKYKSLFIANQGSKEERMLALMDAISEVYASMFHPDPIEYRSERRLLDYQEEMGIMIQEVVGTKIGHYVFPSYAGVAFSQNEYRWSPRIKREDQLIRIVPGLGTRAVDRLSNDYPVMISPGKPDIRVNISIEEKIKYAPKFIDVINLKKGCFETVDIDFIIKNFGNEFPLFKQIFSVFSDNMIRSVTSMVDYQNDCFITTFDKLIKEGSLIKKIKTALNILEKYYQKPIDIEFAATENDFYLLQCRSQSSLETAASQTLPTNISEQKILFTASKYVSNAHIPDITHIVYVNPSKYDDLQSFADIKNVAKVIGQLNKILPKKRFILMGPGRWGSRGDVKLGVPITYSDINNTAVLIEMAFQKGNYLPEPSFGTHFFQDLVEASIYYLPLYPDEKNNLFNINYFEKRENDLSKILPEQSSFSEVVKVFDLSKEKNDLLKIVTNADECKAMAYLFTPG